MADSFSSNRKFVRAVQQLGWIVEQTRGGHYRATAPFTNGATPVIVIFSKTPGARAIWNARGSIRRAYRVAKLDLPDLPLG